MAATGVAAAAAAGAALGWTAERRLLDPERRGPIRRPRVRAADRELAVTGVGGVSLHAETHGDDRAPTLVLAHGWTERLAFWRAQLAGLAPHWRLVAYDQRGHGRSAMPADDNWSVEALGGDLRAVIEATVPTGERCVVAGHSMGGMALLALARSDPAWTRGRVAGSALVSTGANELWRHNAITQGSTLLDRIGCVLVPWALGPRGLLGPKSDLMVWLTRQLTLTAGTGSSLTDEIAEMVLACSPTTRGHCAATLSSLDLSEAIPLVPGPVLVLVGARDRLTPPRQSAVLAAGRADAELVVLPEIGHMAPLEAPEVVTARLDAFAAAVHRPGEAGDAAPTRATAER